MSKLYKVLIFILLISFSGCGFMEEQQVHQVAIEDIEQKEVIHEEINKTNELEEKIGSREVKTSEEVTWKTIKYIPVGGTKATSLVENLDRPILLESFAVWCSVCKSQQDEVKALHKAIGDEIISIAFNIDPNEDEQIVLEHKKRHGYDWQYVIAPEAFTQSLIDEFGVRIAFAPSAPMILLCTSGEFHYLKSGLKQASFLESEIKEKCSDDF